MYVHLATDKIFYWGYQYRNLSSCCHTQHSQCTIMYLTPIARNAKHYPITSKYITNRRSPMCKWVVPDLCEWLLLVMFEVLLPSFGLPPPATRLSSFSSCDPLRLIRHTIRQNLHTLTAKEITELVDLLGIKIEESAADEVKKSDCALALANVTVFGVFTQQISVPSS